MLRKEDVARRIFKAILLEETEVFIPSYTYWMGVAMLFLPMKLRIWVV